MIYFYFDKVVLVKQKPQDIPVIEYRDMVPALEPKPMTTIKSQQELVYDESGLQTIKSVYQELPDPNFSSKEQERHSTVGFTQIRTVIKGERQMPAT